MYPIFLKLSPDQTMLNSSNRCMLAKLDRTLQNNIQMLELLNLSSEDFPRRFLYIPTCISKSEPVLHRMRYARCMQQRFKISLSTKILMEGEKFRDRKFQGRTYKCEKSTPRTKIKRKTGTPRICERTLVEYH